MNPKILKALDLIIDKSDKFDSAIKFVAKKSPDAVIKAIETDIDNFKKIGGYNEIGRIVAYEDGVIKLQKKDNGDAIIYIICNKYDKKTELFKKIEVLCSKNDIELTKCQNFY